MAPTLTPPTPAGALTESTAVEGCDRCGVDQLLRPLRAADVRVDTPAGPVLLCRTHHIAAGAALAAWPVTALR